jgi:hypothetical protein
VLETWAMSGALVRQQFRQQYLRRRLLLRLRQAKAEAVLRYGRQLPPDPEVLYWQQAQVKILNCRNRQIHKLLARGAVLMALPLLGAIVVALPLLILPWSQGEQVVYLRRGGSSQAVRARIELLDQFIRDECRRLKPQQRSQVCRR